MVILKAATLLVSNRISTDSASGRKKDGEHELNSDQQYFAARDLMN